MKILYLSLTPSLRLDATFGPGTHMREVCRALAAQGHELVVSVAAGGAPSPPALVARELGGAPAAAGQPPGARRPAPATGADRLKRCLPPPLRHLLRDLRELWLDRGAAARLARLVDAERIDAVYERCGMLHLAGLQVAAARHLPHLLEFNTPLEERREHHGFPLYRVGRARLRRQLELADQVVCVSSVLRDYLVERGAAPERLHVEPNAVDPTRFALDPGVRPAVRRRLGIGDEEVALGFVGRFGFWHGMVPLVESLIEVARRAPRARVVLIGDGQLMPAVRRTLAGCDVVDRFRLTGNLAWADVPSHLAALDIGIMASSNWYGSPLKLFEYAAAGLCVVAPRVAPVAEIMEHGTDGLLVPPGERQALTAALLELVGDAPRRRRLAAHFRARVEARHVWSGVAARSTQLLARSPRATAAAAGSPGGRA
ncbi:MAG: glycosyltransferase family 4 protein [Candidatus Eiseniibacteriota bacterium]|jgi:glycosyltransferase involved in cell wall biosynthesis